MSTAPATSITWRTWSQVLPRWMLVFWLLLLLMDPCHKLNSMCFYVDRLVSIRSSCFWTRWIWSRTLRWSISSNKNSENCWKSTNTIPAKPPSSAVLLFPQFRTSTPKSDRLKSSNYLMPWTSWSQSHPDPLISHSWCPSRAHITLPVEVL